ncbi:hypothetical protein MTP02_06760 [Streptomyces albus]|nr:hypothetical protein MTP02_06760 [Streptomyces albus]
MAEAEPAGPTRVNAVAAASAMAVARTVFIVLENTHSLSVVSVVPVGYGSTRPPCPRIGQGGTDDAS